MRNMIANISHDFKSPLAGIVCGIEMIRESCTQWRITGSSSRSTVPFHYPINTNTAASSLLSSSGEDIPLAAMPTNDSLDLIHHQDDSSVVYVIEKSLQGMEASYYLMLMTINRSTQYTKTLHNIALLPNTETIEVRDVVQRAISIVCTLQYNARIDFKTVFNQEEEYSSQKTAMWLYTDRQWLLDNLLCLISNAVKYSKPHTLCQVRLRRWRQLSTPPFYNHPHLVYYVHENQQDDHQSDWISFEVEDEGPGLKQEDAEALFTSPDFSEQRRVGGAGLGLFCLGKHIEILKGCYGVRYADNTAGSGLVFWFALPHSSLVGEEGGMMQTSPLRSQQRPQRASPFRTSSTELHIIRDEDINQVANEMRRLDSREESKSSPEKPSSTGSDHCQITRERTNSSFRLQTNPPLQPPSTPISQPSQYSQHRDFYLRILLVDDALPILKMLRMMLENNGHHVVSANNGQAAVDILYPPQRGSETYSTAPEVVGSGLDTSPQTETVFDVILMDLQMPIMDGFEAIRTIRRNEASTHSIAASRSEDALSLSSQDQCRPNRTSQLHRTRPAFYHRTIIIAMSANSDHCTMQRAYAAGADNFIAKPFKMEKFNDALQACWEGCCAFL